MSLVFVLFDPYDWANGGFVDVFLWQVWFHLWGVMLFQRMGMDFKDKIVLYCSREVKYKQGFTTKI